MIPPINVIVPPFQNEMQNLVERAEHHLNNVRAQLVPQPDIQAERLQLAEQNFRQLRHLQHQAERAAASTPESLITSGG